MQLPIEPTEPQLTAILAAVHDDRIDRFLPAAAGSREDAFRLYCWNCRLCEAFYLPLHFAEIAVRNAINSHLINKYGGEWYINRALIGSMDPDRQSDFDKVLQAEKMRHGDAMTCHHLVSELSFGFWQHLLTKRFGRIVWTGGIKDAFPNAPNDIERQQLYDRLEAIRKWRNRIAHHKPIFDRGPSAKHQDLLQLVRWVSHDLADWVTSSSQVTAAIQLRPLK